MPPLGEFLVKKGLITSEQLDVALEVQTLYGGRLGFNLVDLGFLSSQQLTSVLGEFHGVETIEAKDLKRIPWDVLKLVPSELAIKYRILPVALERNRLTLAMSDPTDMNAINEVSFITGCVIRIRIAPDFVMKRALEEHYENVTFSEFIRPLHAPDIQKIKDRAMARSPARDRGLSGPATPLPPAAGLSPPPLPAQPVPAHPAPPRQPRPPVITAQVVERPPAQRPAAEEHGVPPAREDEKTPYQRASWKFGNAQTREDIGRALIEYATGYLRRAVLFTLRKDTVEGWLGFGDGIAPQVLRGYAAPTDRLPCFRDVLASLKYHVVELADSGAEQDLVRALGGTRPRSILVFPLIVRGKPVSILSGDNGQDEPAVSKALWADFAEFEKTVRKAQVAFEMIIMKWWLIQG